MKTVAQLIDDILRREGGFVDHPNDKGGATKYGITHATLASWRGNPVTTEDVRAMTIEEARDIYLHRYFTDEIKSLPEAIQPQAFDINVNGGLDAVLGRLTRYFDATPQEIVDFLGPKSSNIMLAASRIEYYRRITAARPANKAFLFGWLNRAAEFQEWDA